MQTRLINSCSYLRIHTRKPEIRGYNEILRVNYAKRGGRTLLIFLALFLRRSAFDLDKPLDFARFRPRSLTIDDSFRGEGKAEGGKTGESMSI